MTQGKKTVSDQEIINRMQEHNDPAFWASEVADWWGMSDQWARNRLNELVDRGEMWVKRGGERSKIYAPPESAESRDVDKSRAETTC